VYAAFASHNVRSLSHALAYAENIGLSKQDYEVQMLYGMAGPFKYAVRDLGYRVREYAPVGEMLPGMAYLVRRLLENTSNESFLRAKFVEKEKVDFLLQDPKLKIAANDSTKKRTQKMIFENEPMIDFSEKKNRSWIDEQLKKAKSETPKFVPAIVNGVEIKDLKRVSSYNPSEKEALVTEYSLSTEEEIQESIYACQNTIWKGFPVKKRVDIIKKAADLLSRRKKELITQIVIEVGKGFTEADADVCEAIDFCRYYALCAEKMFDGNKMGELPGEFNLYTYKPRGISLSIAPWNFPLAILCGMTVAPLVCGNPVIMKPAEQSSGIALKLYEILRDSGVPKDALHLLPGKGEDVGDKLVKHPEVQIISFTGSRSVGLHIFEESAKVKSGQKHIKKVIAEMGGKNAVIIDDDADLDEAVVGCLHSAFGFSGQKCSALSRIIVVSEIYEKFKERFVAGLESMVVGKAEDVSAHIGPVIDVDSQKRLLKVIKKYDKNIVSKKDISHVKEQGYFVSPTIFESDDFQSELGQNEFFGPLVTLFKVKNFDEAIKAMNDVEYALTGGVYSRSPQNIEKARNEIEVGNLYINHDITGALVYRQPFGGYKMSGAGGKAGGPDYLFNFVEPHTVTENTMRRGFAPEIS